jgi:hypothetical protein
MIAVHVVHVIVVKVASVTVMLNGFMPARLSMLVFVLFMCVTAHKLLAWVAQSMFQSCAIKSRLSIMVNPIKGESSILCMSLREWAEAAKHCIARSYCDENRFHSLTSLHLHRIWCTHATAAYCKQSDCFKSGREVAGRRSRIGPPRAPARPQAAAEFQTPEEPLADACRFHLSISDAAGHAAG